mgnify:CR=1 FL=1
MSDKFESLVSALRDVLSESNTSEEVTFVKFNGDIGGKGFLWVGQGNTKQFIFSNDKFFSSESIDLGRGKELSINNIKVLDETELGLTVTKSSLREVGKLKGLIVDGSMSVNQYMFYDARTDRLGLGTDQPNAAVSIADQGVEIVLGANEYNRAAIGTFNSADVELVTDNTARITISANGNIVLGNRNFGPVQVLVQGTLGIDVNTPDPRTKLHVNGAIKFNDKIHLSGTAPPDGGSFNVGDIVWNSNPQQRHYVGWVCTVAGNPGIWNQFGEIR